MHDRLFEDLAVAVTRLRGGKAAGRIARDILDRDTRYQHLIGLSSTGEAVYFYHFSLQTVVQLPITPTGLGTDLAVSERACLRENSRLETWLTTQNPNDFAWLHPRYRWLFMSSLPELPDNPADHPTTASP